MEERTETKVKYGLLHNHTEESRRDSAMSVAALVARAKELGAPAVALTDHGTMTGYIDFNKCCHENGIKPIFGVEMYVEEANEGRKHLIVMAKNKEGFHALIQIVTETNTRLYDGFPRANKEILRKFFGPGTSGHKNVIATSACVQGVLASIVLANRSVEEDIAAIREEQKAFVAPTDEAYLKCLDLRDSTTESQKVLAAEISALKKLANKSVAGLVKRMEGGKDETKRAQARQEYEEITRQKEAATIELKKKQAKYDEAASNLKNLKLRIAADEKQIAKWMQKEHRINAIQEKYVDDRSLNSRLMEEAKWYDDLFGHGCFYIELQNHGLDMEKNAYPKLAWLSDMMDIPVVAANDAHIPDNNPDSVLARAIVQSTRFQFQKWHEPDKADWEVYVKDDAALSQALSEILPWEKVTEAMENVGKIVDACVFELDNEKHYPKFQTPDGSTPEEYLRKMAYDGIAWRYPDGNFHDYERLEYELGVICSMGYADYHCIVEDFLRYARYAGKLYLDDPKEQKIALTFDTEYIKEYTKDRPGETVGPGRGSAAGSLVCYLIGITNIDPLVYGLLFERFLNPERVSMPDIDCDIETTVREYVIEYVKHKYGQDSVCGIMTKQGQKGKAALITAAKTLALKKGEDTQYYMPLEKQIAKKMVEMCDDELHINLHKLCESEKTVIDPETGEETVVKVESLKDAFADNKIAQEIIHFALCIEGTVLHNGQHAAGVIIADGHAVDNYVPLFMSNKGIMVTSCDMIQAEEIGLLKMDVRIVR